MNTRTITAALVGFALGVIATLVYLNAIPAVFRDKQALQSEVKLLREIVATMEQERREVQSALGIKDSELKREHVIKTGPVDLLDDPSETGVVR